MFRIEYLLVVDRDRWCAKWLSKKPWQERSGGRFYLCIEDSEIYLIPVMVKGSNGKPIRHWKYTIYVGRIKRRVKSHRSFLHLKQVKVASFDRWWEMVEGQPFQTR